MNGPNGVRLQAMVGVTDRGSLWRAARDRDHDTVLRVVEPRFCDGRFRQALTNLRQRQHPRMLKIIGEGWTGGHFYIEYEITPPWQTLEERLAGLRNWHDRITLIGSVCKAMAQWQSGPLHPLGLNLRNVVVMRHAGRWFPWLAPCPAITVLSPPDLFGSDSTVIAALAPELIRGAQRDERSQDAYALGTLAMQALGAAESTLGIRDDETRIEAQARGALLRSAGSRIPSFLHATPQFQLLLQAIGRHRHTNPDARPHTAAQLLAAVNAMSDLIELAGTLQPRRALEVLELATDDPRVAPLAAEISAEIDDPHLALRYLDLAVRLAPDRLDLRRARSELRWQQPRSGTEVDTQLLEDLAELKKHGDRDERLRALKRTAEEYLRTAAPQAAANELYKVIELAPGDLEALLSYWCCWVKLDKHAQAEQTRAEAMRRIERMERNQMLTTREAELWRGRFNTSAC